MKKVLTVVRTFFLIATFFLIMMKFTTTHYNLIIVLATTETRLLLKPYKTKTIQMFFGMYIHFPFRTPVGCFSFYDNSLTTNRTGLSY